MNAVLKQDIRRKVHMTLRVNAEELEVSFAPYKTLLEVLREDLNLTGTKHGCEGRSIETVEGLARGPELHPLQAAFADLGGAQCGYCTPGILMTAKALLDREPNPGRERIKEALSGNLCRCTGYQQIYESVEEAARRLSEYEVGS